MTPLGQTPGLPRHVAIIMDGNGRWAAQRGLPRSAGHRQGLEALRRTVRAAPALGIETLTIYAFSTENWSRPASEVSCLLELLRRFIRRDVAELHEAGVRICVIGERDGLEAGLLRLIEDAERLTAQNTRLRLIVGFNYGGRQEITAAARSLARKVRDGKISPDDITPAVLANHMHMGGVPDPELLIRTGGERRISNFLLWQCAYSEFVYFEEYWPDFGRELLERAIAEFATRDRRFGGLKAQSA